DLQAWAPVKFDSTNTGFKPVPRERPTIPSVAATEREVSRIRPSKNNSIGREFWFVVLYSGTFCHVMAIRSASCLRETVPPADGFRSSNRAATRGRAKCWLNDSV